MGCWKACLISPPHTLESGTLLRLSLDPCSTWENITISGRSVQNEAIQILRCYQNKWIKWGYINSKLKITMTWVPTWCLIVWTSAAHLRQPVIISGNLRKQCFPGSDSHIAQFHRVQLTLCPGWTSLPGAQLGFTVSKMGMVSLQWRSTDPEPIRCSQTNSH